jgi:RNA polymerase sigma-B factor
MLAKLAELDEGSEEYLRQRDRIVRRCLRMADNVAFRYDGRGESREDLVQVARVGLLNAINRFDPQAGSDFVSFALPTMVGEIRRHFRDTSWSVKVPRRFKELYPQLSQGTCALTQRLGRAPTATELAVELGLDRAEIVEALIAGMSHHTVPLAGAEGSDDCAPLLNTLGEIDVNLDTINDRELLRPLLAALPERERVVLLLRFFGPLSQSQIAQRLGISQTHVSRLLAKSLAELRDRIAG